MKSTTKSFAARSLCTAMGLVLIGALSYPTSSLAQKSRAVSEVKQFKIDMGRRGKAKIGLGFKNGGNVELQGTSVTCVGPDGKEVKCPTTIIITSTPD